MNQSDEVRCVVIHPNGKAPPVFWVHPGLEQFQVIRRFSGEQRVFALRGCSPDPDEAPRTLEQIVGYYVETVRRLQPCGQYVLAGYCINAVIAREVAYELLKQGQTVRKLILIHPVDPAMSRAHVVQDPLFFALRYNFHRILFHLHRIREYNPRKKLAYVVESMRLIVKRLRRKITCRTYQACIDSGRRLPFQLNRHQSDVHAFMNHDPQPYPGTAVVLRPAIRPKGAFDYADRRWAQLVTGGLIIEDVPGDSDSMWWRDAEAKMLSHTISSYLP
jgi:thioesterase domain-containing protein